MTPEQWKALEPGDIVIDHKCGGIHRTIIEVKRDSSPKQGRRAGSTVTRFRVANLRNGKPLLLTSHSDGWINGKRRFELYRGSPIA